jgi:hypothetical protein
MTTTNTMTNFIGLSEVLTGFNSSVLAPTLDPVDIKTAYFDEWQQQLSSETNNANLVDQILSSYADLKQKNISNQAIGEALLANVEYEFPCRQLIYLWYMGAWPAVMQSDDATRGRTSFDTLSSDSYTSGLVWQVMQAHPMGDSNYRYGYWGNTPAPLSDYTGNKGA